MNNSQLKLHAPYGINQNVASSPPTITNAVITPIQVTFQLLPKSTPSGFSGVIQLKIISILSKWTEIVYRKIKRFIS